VGLGAKLGGLPLKGIIIYYYFLKAKVDMLSVVLSSCKGNVCKSGACSSRKTSVDLGACS
jgi:hypothetical protein